MLIQGATFIPDSRVVMSPNSKYIKVNILSCKPLPCPFGVGILTPRCLSLIGHISYSFKVLFLSQNDFFDIVFSFGCPILNSNLEWTLSLNSPYMIGESKVQD